MGLNSFLIKAITVEFEVCYWRESRAAGEGLTLILTLRWEDVSAQVPTVVLGGSQRDDGEQTSIIHHETTPDTGR